MSNDRPNHAYAVYMDEPETVIIEYTYSDLGDKYVRKPSYLSKEYLKKRYGLVTDDDTTYGYHIETLDDIVPDWKDRIDKCTEVFNISQDSNPFVIFFYNRQDANTFFTHFNGGKKKWIIKN